MPKRRLAARGSWKEPRIHLFTQVNANYVSESYQGENMVSFMSALLTLITGGSDTLAIGTSMMY